MKESPISIPGFVLDREIGRGGMARVYSAVQQQPHRRIAIKIVSPTAANDENFLQSLKQEGDTVAQFSHPNIVTVYACGVIDGHYYLAMEFMGGGDLTSRIKAGLPPDQAVKITLEMASALEHAHAHKTLHRDIKPENILFHENGKSVLVDFGIAKEQDTDSEFTKLGCVVGTPHYMSPERAQGGVVDNRSDIYALGVVFYEMLTGKKLYDKADTFAISYAHVYEPIPPLPEKLSQYQPLLNKMLAKDPNDRFQNASELVKELERSSQTTRAVSQLNNHDGPTRKISETRIVSKDSPETRVAATSDNSATLVNQKENFEDSLATRAITSAPTKYKWLIPVAIGALLIISVGGYAWYSSTQQLPVDRVLGNPAVNLNRIIDLKGAARSLLKFNKYEDAAANYAKVLSDYDCNDAESRSSLKELDPQLYIKTIKQCESR
ncbi:MAG: serine/threonine protein kinase [bacterium]